MNKEPKSEMNLNTTETSEERDKYLSDLAKSYSEAISHYENQGDTEKTEYYHLKSIDVLEELVTMQKGYLPNLPPSYNRLGDFYKNMGDAEKAKHYYLKAISADEELVKINPNIFEIHLVTDYYNYAVFKNDNDYFKKAFELAEKNSDLPECKQIFEQLKDKFN
jgi:tetratricopeptide (TPR) repeat protein